MKRYKSQKYDNERALYGESNAVIENCDFSGVADGESALKETNNLTVKNSVFKLRYPLWHTIDTKIISCEMFETCRAPLWYDKNILLDNIKILGVKAVRECENVKIFSSEINSQEFCWKNRNVEISQSKIFGEYAFLATNNIKLSNVSLNGKYSFQYVEKGEINNCELITKDAFWHSKNLTVTNSIITGEYLGWYSENLTLINCIISGTQPLCYANNLKLINCEMKKCDLSFENSTVDALINGSIDSVKNPIGKIVADSIGETKIDKFSRGKCKIIIK